MNILTIYADGFVDITPSACLVLIRGLPGSGKSTMARGTMFDGFEHYEADMYFERDGEYCYDVNRIRDAHEWCQSETFNALASGKRVVVSNTFTRLSEMEPYFEMANALGIQLTVLEATGRYQNLHKVPAYAVERMRKRWEPMPDNFKPNARRDPQR